MDKNNEQYNGKNNGKEFFRVCVQDSRKDRDL